MPRIAACNSCRTAIVWAVTAAGKPMPVDWLPSQRGQFLLLPGPNSSTLALHEGADRDDVRAAVAAGKSRHTSHFATCPQADQHRKAAP